MIEIVIRSVGHGEWMPLIRVLGSGQVLYHGERHKSAEAAFARASQVWEEGLCADVREWRRKGDL